MASLIKTVQTEIENRIEAILAAEGVDVLSRLRGNISNDIAARLAKKGICVLAFPPSIGGIKPNVTSCLFAQQCKMELHVCETPKTNQSGIDAYEVVERLLSLNNHKTANGVVVAVTSVEDASPESQPVVEFVMELQMNMTFAKV